MKPLLHSARHMTVRTGASVISILFVFAAGAGGQADRTDAAGVWEQTIAAKGGRDRLLAIRSFAIRETFRLGHKVRGVVGGKVDQIVCELPDKWWEFLDYRPGDMGYSVHVVNARTGLGWASYGGLPAHALMRPDTNTAYRLRQLQYVYFLETRSVRPVPRRVSRVRLGFSSVNRLETDVDGETVVFYLDPKTHLPKRIETVRLLPLKPPRPGRDRPISVAERRYVYELDRYHAVGGVQVPGRVKLGRDTAEARVEIEPSYDPSIFSTPPPAGAGIDSWRR